MRPLPIDPHLDAIRDAVDRARACVVVAPPGAGKTTRVPPVLLDRGRCVVLQPRRAAARSLARRIASERGWTEGREVGWQVRFERRCGRDTRLLIATEGVLTARLQTDPLLSGFATVVLDEFHERSVHADLALALAREALRARDDLRVVVMSATLDPGPVADYLDGAPSIEVAGRPHPVAVEHAPGSSVADGVRAMLERTDGHVLAFLPGAGEIDRTRRDLRDAESSGLAVVPLHGGLPTEEQDAALAPTDGRKVVLATNLAETSVTVEGVTAVVDTGLHKVLRYDVDRGIDRLEVERAPDDAIEQRAGRAGRTGPGVALRLWDPRDERPARRQPELMRIDLAAVVLDIAAWGGSARNFPWFEPPPDERVAAALELLEALGAIEDDRVTDRGLALRRLPLHPRLARLVEAAGGSERACAAAAWIAESRQVDGDGRTTSSDLSALADRVREAPRNVRRARDQIRALAGSIDLPAVPDRDASFRRAVLAAWPDRVARRREPGSDRLLLARGSGARLAAGSGVRHAEFVVAVDVHASRRGPGGEPIVRLASAVEREWLKPDRVTIEHRFDDASASVRASAVERYGAIPLVERPVDPDPDVATALLVEELARRGLAAADAAWLRRARFAGVDIDLPALRRQACHGRARLPEFHLRHAVAPDVRRTVERLAPDAIRVPSGRNARLDYRADGNVVLSIRIQELFGLAETPRIGANSTPVTLELLAPNGRPAQVTTDLGSFWERGYPEVRRELRGRYPKHPWPEDPRTAPAAARPRRRTPRK